MPPDANLKALLNRRTRALTRHLPAAVEGQARGVHQARVATRRLREAVPILVAGTKGTRRRRTARTLRRITRALGPVREADVSLAAIGERRWADADRAAVSLVASRLQRLRAERREEMLARLAAIDEAKLVARLGKIAAAASDAETAPIRRARLASRLTRRAHALREAIEEAGALYAPERLHAVRIAAKTLRYALELAGEMRIADTGESVRVLKRAQDVLGRLHDLQVLGVHVKAVEAEPDPHRVTPPETLGHLTRAIETECRALHARYVSAASGLSVLAESVLASVVPVLDDTRAASRRAAPLKMTLAATSPRRRPRRAAHRAD